MMGVGGSIDTVAQRPRFRRRCGAKSDNMKKDGEYVLHKWESLLSASCVPSTSLKNQHSVRMLTHVQHAFQIS